MKNAETEKAFKAFIDAPRSDFWKTYFWHKRDRFKMIVDSIPHSLEATKVLDVGPTDFTVFLKEIFPSYEISTVDLTDHLKDACEAKGIQFNTCDLHERYIPFPDNYFDVVIFCGVLEHIFAPPTEILNEIRRIIRPKGKLIFAVPNIARLDYRIKLLFGISPLEHPDRQMRKGMHGHIHEYTMKECTSLLKNCNFTIVKKKHVTTNVFRKRGIRHLAGLILYAWRLIPSCGLTIYVECRKEVM